MKKYSFSLIALLLYSISTLAESKYLYYVGNDEIKRYIVNISEYSYWEGAGSSLHMETGLVLGNAILCEPELGNYNGVIIKIYNGSKDNTSIIEEVITNPVNRIGYSVVSLSGISY